MASFSSLVMNLSPITISRIHGRIIRFDYIKDAQFHKEDESILQQGLKDLVASNKVRLDFICISLGVMVLFATESPSNLLWSCQRFQAATPPLPPKKRKNNNFKPGFKISSENQFLLCGYVNLLLFLNLIVLYVHWLFCFPRRGYEWTSESSHNNSGLMHGLGIDFVLSYKLTVGLTRFLLSSHMQIWFAKRF